MSVFNLMSVNVRGLRDEVKRTAVFASLQHSAFSVCFLQEVHLRDSGDISLFSKEWGRGESRWSVGGVHSTGVGILFGDRDIKVIDGFSLVQGRVLVVDGDWRGQRLRFINVYAPSEPGLRKDLLVGLGTVCMTNRHIILGGDFNVSFEKSQDFSLTHLKSLISQFSLVDGFRHCNPGKEGVTWQNSRGSKSRIDYFFVSRSLSLVSSTVSPVWFSDHHSLALVVSFKVPVFGRGFWKLNCDILREKDFIEQFAFFYKEWVDLKKYYSSVIDWWEGVKVKIKVLAQGYCRARAVRNKGEFFRLQRALEALYSKGNNGGDVNWDKCAALKAKLREHCEKRASVFLFKGRREFVEKHETCSSYFFKQIKNAQGKRVFNSLKRSDGITVHDNAGMLQEATAFYQVLFKEKEVDKGVGDSFLDRVEARVPEGVREGLEQPISIMELTEALRGMKNNKVPGGDGLPKEFYVTFWDMLSKDFLEVVHEIFISGSLGASMKEGIISLLFKKGDPEELKNWRPVTLLGVDYKLIAKVLTGRLKKVLPLIVNEDQTCGVEGRSILWNLQLIRDAISWAQDRALPLMLVSLDQEKAFDRVNHGFLFRILGRFGFGEQFLRWINIMYTGAGSRVNLNGFLGELIRQESGVRQGCPLSPLLYVLFMEPFAVAVREDQNIEGLQLPGSGGSTVKISQYADDTTLFLSTEYSWMWALQVIERFALASGSKLNLTKSTVKFFGTWRGRKDDLGGLQNCPGALKLLGVSFDHEGNEMMNWCERISWLRVRIGLWKTRNLSYSGKVLVIKADVLPSLLYLSYVFPVPAQLRKVMTQIIFNFMWGGKYEYITRVQMYQPVEEGGRDVPHIPLKMDCLFFCNLCVSLTSPVQHKFQFFVLFWFSVPMRRLIVWDNRVPKAEQMPEHYKHAVKWSKRHVACQERQMCLSHRELYGAIREELGRGREQVGSKKVWVTVQPKGLDNILKDLNWMGVHKRLAVREVLYRHKLTRNKFCPRDTCMAEETQSHVFWDCPFAAEVWGEMGKVFDLCGARVNLCYEKVMFGLVLGGVGKRVNFLVWLLISLVKKGLWDSRGVLIKSNVKGSVRGVVERVKGDIRRRVKWEVDKWGFNAAKERWKELVYL